MADGEAAPAPEPATVVEAGEEPPKPEAGTAKPGSKGQMAAVEDLSRIPAIPPPPPPLRRTKSTVVPASKRAKPVVDQVAVEEASLALQYRNHYIAKDVAYHAKLEMAKRRREALMPVKKQTLTTPKTLAHDKEELIRATTPQWRHTWSNQDPHDVADAQKQIEKTHDACKQQDMQMFTQDVQRRRQEKELKEKKEADLQKSVMQQSMITQQKQNNVLEKVASQQLQMQQNRADRYMSHEARSKEFKDKLERDRQDAIKQKSLQKEMRAEAARRKAEEEKQRVAARKLELAMEKEMKRKAMKGREESMKQYDAKIQRNRIKSANMKNRINQVKDEFEQQAQAKHAALLASLDRSNKQKETLLDQRAEALKNGHMQKDIKMDAKLKTIAAQKDEYCMHKMEKIMHTGEMLEKRKKEQEVLRREWLEGERARIYDDFMRKEVLIDTLNTKKIRDEFAEVWTSAYPIKEFRPKTSTPADS